MNPLCHMTNINNTKQECESNSLVTFLRIHCSSSGCFPGLFERGDSVRALLVAALLLLLTAGAAAPAPASWAACLGTRAAPVAAFGGWPMLGASRQSASSSAPTPVPAPVAAATAGAPGPGERSLPAPAPSVVLSRWAAVGAVTSVRLAIARRTPLVRAATTPRSVPPAVVLPAAAVSD